MADVQEGLVVSHLGKGIAVEYDNQIILCHPRRKLDTVAVGDRVEFSQTAPDQGSIESILPRQSLLSRPSRNNKTRPVAANISHVYVVFAVEPNCDFLLIDQYLALCENLSIEAVLVHNKVDIPGSDSLQIYLGYYQSLGYSLHQVSAKKGIGIDGLKADLGQHTSIFTGQSGVGKSSLTNALLPDKDIKTNTVSETTRHGRHTTTAATLYHLPSGGDLIDSPGVAIFGLANTPPVQLAWGYREFQPLLEQCRFHNCQHVNDKGCRIRAMAEENSLFNRRYQRYLKLLDKLPKARF